MQFFLKIGKNIVSWVTSTFRTEEIEPQLAQRLQEELLNIKTFLYNLSQEIDAQHPLLKTIIVSSLNFEIFKIHQEQIAELKKSPIKALIQSCDDHLKICMEAMKYHNDAFEKFVQTYIKNGLSLTGINTFDPQKMTAYKDVHAAYITLMQSAKSLKDQCEITLKNITELLERL